MTPPHGTLSRYTRHRCKCEDCRAAWSAYQRGWRRRVKERGLPDDDPRHGTVSGRRDYGCHCGDCREAGNAYQRKRYWQYKGRDEEKQ